MDGMTTQPTKVEPVAGTATPRTDAESFNAPQLDSTMRSNDFEVVSATFARSLESALTLAREKIAELQFERDSFLADRDALLLSRDTARASLAAVTAKMEAMRVEASGYLSVQENLYPDDPRITAIITQEEGKP